MPIREFLRWFVKSDEPRAQRVRRIVNLIIVLGLFIAILWIVPVRSVIQALSKTNPVFFTIGVVLSLGAIFLTSVLMKPLLNNQGIKRNIFQIFRINLTVKFYLLLMPTTLVASGVRWYRFAQPEGKVAESFVALAFFRLFDIFLTLTMGLGFLLISTQQRYQISIVWLALLILFIIIFWVVITRYSLPLYKWFRTHARNILDRSLLQPVLRIIEKLLFSASSYANMPVGGLLLVMSAGISSALVGVASGVFLARSIVIDLGFMDLGWVLAIVSLAAQLPFTIMEGLGIREVTLVAVLSIFNISTEQALALSFLIFSRGVIIALIGGVNEALFAIRNKRVTRLGSIQGEGEDT